MGDDVPVGVDEPTELGIAATDVLAALDATVPAYGPLGAFDLVVKVELDGDPFVGERARSDHGSAPELDPVGLFCVEGRSLFVPVRWTVSSEPFGSCTGPALVVAQESDPNAIWVGTPFHEPSVCDPGPTVLDWAATVDGCSKPWAFELQQDGRPDLPWSEGISGFLTVKCSDGGASGVTFGDVAGEYAPGEFPP